MHHIARIDPEVKEGRVVNELRNPLPLDSLNSNIAQTTIACWELSVLKEGSTLLTLLERLLVLGHDYRPDDGVVGLYLLGLEGGEVVGEEVHGLPNIVLSYDLVVRLGAIAGAAPGHHRLIILMGLYSLTCFGLINSFN